MQEGAIIGIIREEMALAMMGRRRWTAVEKSLFYCETARPRDCERLRGWEEWVLTRWYRIRAGSGAPAVLLEAVGWWSLLG